MDAKGTLRHLTCQTFCAAPLKLVNKCCGANGATKRDRHHTPPEIETRAHVTWDGVLFYELGLEHETVGQVMATCTGAPSNTPAAASVSCSPALARISGATQNLLQKPNSNRFPRDPWRDHSDFARSGGAEKRHSHIVPGHDDWTSRCATKPVTGSASNTGQYGSVDAKVSCTLIFMI